MKKTAVRGQKTVDKQKAGKETRRPRGTNAKQRESRRMLEGPRTYVECSQNAEVRRKAAELMQEEVWSLNGSMLEVSILSA